MSEHDNDAALILAASVTKEGAELAASVLRENGLCAEVQNMVAQPELEAT